MPHDRPPPVPVASRPRRPLRAGADRCQVDVRMTALSSPQWPTTDLVARLRALHEVWANESADRLEALTAEVAKLRDDIGPGVTGAELRALVNTSMVSVRCRVCQCTAEVFRSNENHWYETHHCVEASQ